MMSLVMAGLFGWLRSPAPKLKARCATSRSTASIMISGTDGPDWTHLPPKFNAIREFNREFINVRPYFLQFRTPLDQQVQRLAAKVSTQRKREFSAAQQEIFYEQGNRAPKQGFALGSIICPYAGKPLCVNFTSDGGNST